MQEKINKIGLTREKSDFEAVKITNSSDAYNVIKKFWHEDVSIYESFFILQENRLKQFGWPL